MSLPEITDAERLTLRPGDALVIRFQQRIRSDDAKAIEERVRVILRLEDSTPVLILDGDARVEVMEQPGEISR